MASWAGGSIARKRTNGHGLQARGLTATLALKTPFPQVLRYCASKAWPNLATGPQPDPGTEFNQRHAEV